MKDLLDILFRFPDQPDANPAFVTSVLSLLTVPVIVVDRKIKAHLVNLQGQDMLFRLAAESEKEQGTSRGRRDKPVFPGSLKRPIRDCMKSGRSRIVCAFAAPGLRSDYYDVVLCPGEIQSAKFCFVLLLPALSDPKLSASSALDVIMESANGGTLWLDSEARFRKLNKRYLEAFGLKADEALGLRVTELNPSKQAEILENQIKHLMRADEIRNSQADPIPTAKRGIVVTSIRAWPLRSETGECEGLFAIVQPSPGSAPLSLLNETTKELFGQTAIKQGPPMFFTHLDGSIITMNLAARNLVENGGDGTADLKSAIPWAHPELIDQLYGDLLGGLNCSMLHTDIKTAEGNRILAVQAYGLKEVGDITSVALVHMQDVTDIEHSRRLLAQTARRLATEKEILDRVIEGVRGIRLAYAVVDRELNTLRVSESAAARLGKTPSEFTGRKFSEISDSFRKSGIIAYIKTAIERNQSISVDRLELEFPGGEKDLVSCDFHPISVGGKQACLLISENLTESEARESKLTSTSRRLRSLLDNLEEGVAVLDRHGNILDANHVIYGALRMTREEVIGKSEREVMMIEEGDLLTDFRRRALKTRKPVRTGCIRLTSKFRDASIFADISYIPLLTPEGAVGEILGVVRYLTDVVNLEKKVEAYTANLKRLVRERTAELTSANEDLEATVGKLASMAQSGLVLSSLKDLESVMHAFLEEARQVLAADFVSVALVTSKGGSSRTTYYSSGKTPPSGAIPSDVIERSLAGLTLNEPSSIPDRPSGENILIRDFSFSELRGVLLAWKENGRFSTIDGNLTRLLCSQLGFALPITTYVGDLRAERDRSRCLRRIAYRSAGATSVGSAIGVVAEEISKVIAADRFYWMVAKSGGDIWLSEIRMLPAAGLVGRKHLSTGEAQSIAPVLKHCMDSHRVFCERFPDFGREGFPVERHLAPTESCAFADPRACDDLVRCFKDLLRSRDMIRQNEGSIALAPVVLSQKSCGLICAYNEVGVPFTGEESCFMCLAASTVGHMWQAAHASSSMRRLEAEGETLSELAHDLKYPLMRVRDILERAGSRGKTTKKDRAALGEIDNEISTINLLAEELIDISDRKGREPELLDVGEVIDRCINLMSQDAMDRSVSVKMVADSTLPPAFANRKDVKNILINVLANCVEAVGEDGSVEIAAVPDDSGSDGAMLKVLVSDSGPGVPEDLLTRIFDPFYSTRGGGRGVGLFSAKKRANANGGDVSCEIGENGRSRFVISLPLAS